MTTVLLIGATRPAPLALRNAVTQLTRDGAVVDAALFRDDPAGRRGLPLRDAHVIKAVSGLAADERPITCSPRWLRAVTRVLLRDKLAPKLDLSGRAWITARLDPWVLSRAAAADVVVSLDRYATYTVWRLARRNRRAAALHGLDAAVRHVRSGS